MRSEQMRMSTEVGQGWDTASGAAELDLGEQTVTLLRSRLPEVAEQTVRAIIVQVPAYTDALSGPIGANIRAAVELALGGFLRLAGGPSAAAAGSPLAPALDGAYALGRGEARSGRSMEALLAAYRIGARVSWRDMSRVVVGQGMEAEELSAFAERAGWEPPGALTAVLLPEAQLRGVLGQVDDRTLAPTEDVPGAVEGVGL